MFTYRSSGLWSNSVVFHIVLSALIWLPIFVVVFATALDSNDFVGFLPLFGVLIVIAMYLFKRAQTKIRFPTVELTKHHLILNIPAHKRTVYNIDQIVSPRIVFGTLIFRHLGWPVVATIGAMPKETQAELMALMEAGCKNKSAA